MSTRFATRKLTFISRTGESCVTLCHNPAIPIRVGQSLAVSLGNAQRAANVLKTRMNTAILYRAVVL